MHVKVIFPSKKKKKKCSQQNFMKFSLYNGKYRFLMFTPKHSINAFCTADDLFLFKAINVFVSFMHLGNCFWNTSMISNCDNLVFDVLNTTFWLFSVIVYDLHILIVPQHQKLQESGTVLPKFNNLNVILCIHEIQSQTNQTKK